MAIPVEIILSAKDEASAVFDKAGSSLSSMAGIASGVAVAGVAAVGAGLVVAGAAAINMASDINGATNDISAQLGISKEQAEGFEGVMKGVFANNFGEDFNDISSAVVSMQQNLKDLTPASGEAQQSLLEGAFAIRDAFDVDVGETMQATSSLMREFGLTSQEATDFLTAGMQQGLNASDDFLETINEYSTQFSEGGATASEFFSVMESGMQGGALGTDKAADAFKEFRVRIQDGSDTTAEALGAIGINAEELTASMADGSVTASDAFQLVVDKLGEVDDQNVLIQSGVALMGGQFEDLGQDAVLAISTVTASVEEMAGTTESLNQQYEDLPAVIQGVWRGLLVAIEPAGDALLNVANQIMPTVSDFINNTLNPAIEGLVQWFTDNLPGAIQTVSDFFNNTLMPAIETARDFFTDAMSSMDTSNSEAMNSIMAIVETAGAIIQEVFGAVQSFLEAHGEDIKRVITTAWQAIETIITAAVDQIQNYLELILAVIRGDWERVGKELQDIVRTSFNLILDIVKLIGPLIIDAVKGIVKAIVKAFTDIEWSAIGRGMMDGVRGGIASMAGSLGETAVGTAKSAFDKTKNFLGIGSPSRLFHDEIGIPIGEGMALGILSTAAQVEAAAVGVVQQATSAAQAEMDAFLIGLGVTDLGSAAAAGVGAIRGGMSAGSSLGGDTRVLPGTEAFVPIPAGTGFGGATQNPGPTVHFNDCNFNGTDRDAAHMFGNQLADDLRRECGF